MKDSGEWHGTDFEFDVFRYDKLVHQIGRHLAIAIDWEKAQVIHLSVSYIVPKEETPFLGNPDLLNR